MKWVHKKTGQKCDGLLNVPPAIRICPKGGCSSCQAKKEAMKNGYSNCYEWAANHEAEAMIFLGYEPYEQEGDKNMAKDFDFTSFSDEELSSLLKNATAQKEWRFNQKRMKEWGKLSKKIKEYVKEFGPITVASLTSDLFIREETVSFPVVGYIALYKRGE